MSENERLHQLQALRQKEHDACSEKPEYFIFGLCKTVDQHDRREPIKGFPNLEFLRHILYLIQKVKRLIIVKSRKLLITWVVCAYCLWLGMFHVGQYIFIQAMKEDDADELVKRIWGMYERLPDWLKEVYPAAYSHCKITFLGRESIIRGIAQGGDIIRMHTASFIFSDECDFQPEFEEAYVAALPTLEGGGTGVFVSTPGRAKKLFYRLVFDITE